VSNNTVTISTSDLNLALGAVAAVISNPNAEWWHPQYRALFNRIVKTLEARMFTHIINIEEPGYRLLKNIPVKIVAVDSEYTASFVEANISMSDITRDKSVEALCSVILDVYDSIADEPDEKLGPAMQHTRTVLIEHVTKDRT